MFTTLPTKTFRSEGFVTLTLPPNYGYCILVAVGSVGVMCWKAHKVREARSLYNIEEPIMYSDTIHHFNCVQRAHQNRYYSVERYPQFLTLLLIGGLDSPLWCTAGGVVYLLGRIALANGYYTGDPKQSYRGKFGVAGLLIMMGATVKLAFKLLQVF